MDNTELDRAVNEMIYSIYSDGDYMDEFSDDPHRALRRAETEAKSYLVMSEELDGVSLNPEVYNRFISRMKGIADIFTHSQPTS